MKKRGHEIPTIDVSMISIQVPDADEIVLKTANQIGVNPVTETQDAVKLIVKGALIAQKPADVTITGNTIVMRDNVFNPEMVKILQGGVIQYWQDAQWIEATGTEDKGYGVASYHPPVAGSAEKGELFSLHAYSAVYDSAGLIVKYEKITYPNCRGTPIGLQSQDGAFRAPEYTINSAPKTGQAAYTIAYVKALPTMPDLPDIAATAETQIAQATTTATTKK